jgi:hypothetical protein
MVHRTSFVAVNEAVSGVAAIWRRIDDDRDSVIRDKLVLLHESEHQGP